MTSYDNFVQIDHLLIKHKSGKSIKQFTLCLPSGTNPGFQAGGAGDKQIFFFQIRIHIVLINYQPRQILRYNHLPTKTKHTKHY